MKYLKLFESNVRAEEYIQQCFLDVSENQNFEVDDLIKVELTEKPVKPMSVYKIHIELGKSITLPQPISSNLYIGMVKTNLDFLNKKNEILSELYQDIDIALKRVKDNFPISEYQIYANRRDEIDIVIIIKD